jgi:glycosyltransferase involved in cell wall biosynthesis
VHGEGISNAILEYMALGKPVVATRGGGTAEILLDGETGFLVNPKAVDELTQKLALLLDQPETAVVMGKAGADRVEKHFNLEDMAVRYADLYRRVLEGHAPVGSANGKLNASGTEFNTSKQIKSR